MWHFCCYTPRHSMGRVPRVIHGISEDGRRNGDTVGPAASDRRGSRPTWTTSGNLHVTNTRGTVCVRRALMQALASDRRVKETNNGKEKSTKNGEGKEDSRSKCL